MASRKTPSPNEVSKALNRRRATRVKLTEAPADAPPPPVVAPVATLVEQPRQTEPVNMAEKITPFQKNDKGQIIVPDDDAMIIDEWYRRASSINDLAGALLLFTDLTSKYQHSYGSFIHAVAVFSALAGKLLDMSDQGRADEFQRQMIGFTLLRIWHNIPMDEPIKMFRFNDLLSQSMANVQTFRMLDPNQANWLRRKALEKLANTPSTRLYTDTRRYLQGLSAGVAPAGFTTMPGMQQAPTNQEKKE